MVSNLRAQSGVDAILEKCAAAAYGGGEKGSLPKQTSVFGKAGAIQQSVYPSSPGKWQVHLALENSRISTGNAGIFFRVKAESHYQGFTQAPT